MWSGTQGFDYNRLYRGRRNPAGLVLYFVKSTRPAMIAGLADPPRKARQVLYGWSRSKKNYSISSIPSFSMMIIPCLSVVMPSCSL